MNNENKKIDFSINKNQTLIHLVNVFLSEEYSIKNAFPTKSLEEIKNEILDANENLYDDPSFVQSKVGLIMILQELELSGSENLPIEPLNVLFTLNFSTEDNDFYKVYAYFKNTQSLPFGENVVLKLLGQQLSLSLACMGQRALHPYLKDWWSSRESSISLLLDPEKSETKLHPDLITALDRLALLYTDLLSEPVFPSQTVENSLKYVLSLSDAEDFVPVPIEAGYLLFFFGQSDFLDRFLNNSLNISGIEADEIVDFGFRMIRTQKLKSKAFSQKEIFTKHDLELLEEDHEVLSQILSRLFKRELLKLSEAA